MKYFCWLYQIEIRKDRELWWVRSIELPFVPAKGITLRFLNDDEEQIQGIIPDLDIHHVEYVLSDDVFHCYGKFEAYDGCCPCKKEEDCPNCRKEYNRSRKNWRKHGWELIWENPKLAWKPATSRSDFVKNVVTCDGPPSRPKKSRRP